MIFWLQAVKDYQRIEAERQTRAMGFSLRHTFHFTESEDGISKRLHAQTKDTCDCPRCLYRKLDFKTFLNNVRDMDRTVANLSNAFGLYLTSSRDQVDAYEMYRRIIKENEGDRQKRVTVFIAYYNLVALHNLIEPRNNDLYQKVRKYIASIDLEEILWNDLDGLKKNVRNYLRDIRDRKAAQNIDRDLKDLEAQIKKIEETYNNGGHYISVPNYTDKYTFLLQKLYWYYHGNYFVGDAFNDYRDLANRIFTGLVKIVELKKYPYRIEHFPEWILIEAILNIESTRLHEICTKKALFVMKAEQFENLSAKLVSFLESFPEENTSPYTLNTVSAQFLSADGFKRKCARIFTNLFIILNAIKYDGRYSFDKRIGDALIAFLHVEEFLYWWNLEKIGFFLIKNGHRLSSRQLVEIITLANRRNTRKTNKYQKLLQCACDALNVHFPKVKISESFVVSAAIENARMINIKPNYQYLIALWKVVDLTNQLTIRDAIDTYLNMSFDEGLYDTLLRQHMYTHDYGNYFGQYVSTINQSKGKGFMGMKDGSPEYSDLFFENFISLVYWLKIPFDDPRLVFTRLSDHERWLLKPHEFDYNLFNPEWLLVTNLPIYQDRLKDVKIIGIKLKAYLSQHFNPELSKIFFKYYSDC